MRTLDSKNKSTLRLLAIGDAAGLATSPETAPDTVPDAVSGAARNAGATAGQSLGVIPAAASAGPRDPADNFYCIRYRVWYPSFDCAIRTLYKTTPACADCDQGRFNLKRHLADVQPRKLNRRLARTLKELAQTSSR